MACPGRRPGCFKPVWRRSFRLQGVRYPRTQWFDGFADGFAQGLISTDDEPQDVKGVRWLTLYLSHLGPWSDEMFGLMTTADETR
jgi:hypothetical protein